MEEDRRLYPDLHRLKLVCKRFRDVFLEHHDLFSVVLLRQNLRVQALPGLLVWLQRHNTDVRCLQDHCGGSYVCAALSSLHGTQQLTSVHLRFSTVVEVQILSVCTSVTVCTLLQPHKHLNLYCLNNLPKLVDLHLACGTFSNVPLTLQLTCLTLRQATVSTWFVLRQATIPTTDFDSKMSTPDEQKAGLQELDMVQSELKGPQEGICAFTGLRSLTCNGSNVITSKEECKLNTVDASTANLSGLTSLMQLEALELQTFEAYPSLAPVYMIKSLTHLCIGCGTTIYLTTGLSCVNNLKTLQLAARTSRPQAKLDVPWHHMRALQVLHVINVDFTTSDMLALLHLKDMMEISFFGSQPVGLVSAQHFAALSYNLGLKRPDICFDISKIPSKVVSKGCALSS
ncbi:hypothetical protein ABBQ38_009104 [Trebouxia sp. C0009 RCD-2024]